MFVGQLLSHRFKFAALGMLIHRRRVAGIVVFHLPEVQSKPLENLRAEGNRSSKVLTSTMSFSLSIYSRIAKICCFLTYFLSIMDENSKSDTRKMECEGGAMLQIEYAILNKILEM